MNFGKILAIMSVGVLAAACAHNDTTVFSDKKIEGPKVVALDAPRTPWVVEIESRLRKEGFQVLRWSSQKRVQEQTSGTTTEEYQAASTRYILAIDGYAPTDVMNRCFAGGYKFSSLTAELIDVKTNETLFSVSGSGYSENCPPMSGTLFTNIVSAVKTAWR